MNNNNTSREYTTPAQDAKHIHEALKAAGISSRQVSVRSDSFSGGSAIHVKVRDLAVDVALVTEIAKGSERIDRCEFSGDILSGCNRYVTVDLDSDAVRAAGEVALAEGAFRGVKIERVATASDGFEWSHAGTSSAQPCHITHVIEQIARMNRAELICAVAAS